MDIAARNDIVNFGSRIVNQGYNLHAHLIITALLLRKIDTSSEARFTEAIEVGSFTSVAFAGVTVHPVVSL